MRTGGCKYGATCKFHHPPPMFSIQGSALMFPGSSANSSQMPHQTYPSLSSWSLQRPPYLPSPGPSDFTPILIPSPQVPIPSWNPYSVSQNSLSLSFSLSLQTLASVFGVIPEMVYFNLFKRTKRNMTPKTEILECFNAKTGALGFVKYKRGVCYNFLYSF